MDSVLVLDFGGQTAQLISRRIREIGVYSETLAGDCSFGEIPPSINWTAVRGIILSGGPAGVGDPDAPQIDSAFLNCGLPVLGICYGLQRMTCDLGGKVAQKELREFGRARVMQTVQAGSALFRGIPKEFTAWMSHGDSIEEAAPDFQIIAESANGHVAALAHGSRPLYGLQFHPEVSHCEYGREILQNFALEICGADAAWNMSTYLEEAAADIRKTGRNASRPSPHIGRGRFHRAQHPAAQLPAEISGSPDVY